MSDATKTENGKAEEKVLDGMFEDPDVEEGEDPFGEDQGNIHDEDRLHYEVYTTTRYDIFDFSNINREVEPSHVNTLMESMQKHGFLKQKHILVDPAGVVIEGQHRLKAAMKLGIPVYYTIHDEPFNVELVRDLNMGKSWSLENFIKTTARNGREDYQKYRDFTKRYGLSNSAPAYIIGTTTRTVKAGRMEWPDDDGYAHEVGEFISTVSDATGVSFVNRRPFITALKQFIKHDIVDGTELARKAIKAIQRGDLYKRSDIELYLKSFKDIWNYNRPGTSNKRVKLSEIL